MIENKRVFEKAFEQKWVWGLIMQVIVLLKSCLTFPEVHIKKLMASKGDRFSNSHLKTLEMYFQKLHRNAQ